MKERLTWPSKATGTSIKQIMKASSRGQLEHFAPRKGNNMNVINNETPVGDAGIVDVKHFYIDAEGNRIEIPFDIDGNDGTGETTQEETTVYIAADGADHSVTIH